MNQRPRAVGPGEEACPFCNLGVATTKTEGEIVTCGCCGTKSRYSVSNEKLIEVR